MTIKKLLDNQTIDRLDAELLLAHVLKESREYLIAHEDGKVSIFKLSMFKKLVKKRLAGVPIAHLTGHKEFFGLNFIVNKHTLVPRPDTEVMVENVLDNIKKTVDQKITLVDIGTGSGCIPIAINKHIPNFKFQISNFATDISRRALKVAKKNAANHNTNITFLHGDLLQPAIKHIQKSSPDRLIITANLPYLTEEQFQNEQSIQHEPKSALVAEEAGLALYRKLSQQIKILNSKFDILAFFEIDPTQSTPIKTLIHQHFPTATIQIHKDLAGHDRIVEVGIDSGSKN